MYYVVYLQDFNTYVTIPISWLRDDRTFLQKFMRQGMNSSQIHWCYYSDHHDSKIMRGHKLVPNVDFKADFNAAPSRKFPCDGGSFECQVADFFGKYI